MSHDHTPASGNSNPAALPRLTRRQLAAVQEFAQGYDIATVAARRGRGLSSTYELTGRICSRLGLSGWQEIGPWAASHGVDRESATES